MAKKSPYSGRRKLAASASAVNLDEKRVVKRYEYLQSVSKCAQEFGVSWNTIRAVLRRNGVEVRKPTRSSTIEIDENAVVRSYERLGSLHKAAAAQGMSAELVKEIISRNGVPLHTRPTPIVIGASERYNISQRRRRQREPSPADLLRPGEAAAIIGSTAQKLNVACHNGVIKNYGSVRFPLYRRDEILALPAAGND